MHKILFFLPMLLNCSGNSKKSESRQPTIFQKDCGCLKDFESDDSFKSTKSVLLKNYHLIEKNGIEILEGNCGDGIRTYLNDSLGNEFETEELICISKNTVQIKLSDSTKYHFYVSGDETLTSSPAKKYLFEDLVKNPKSVLLVEILPKEKTAVLISRGYNFEEK